MDTICLKGQTAIVTGGGSGIGRAICVSLAAHGANVIIACRSTDKGEETVELVKKIGGTAHFIKTDVTSKRMYRRWCQRQRKSRGSDLTA